MAANPPFGVEWKPEGDKRKKLGEGDAAEHPGEPNHIDAITQIYAAFKDNEQRSLQSIGTNVDSPKDKKRSQDQAIYVSKIFNNQDFGYFKITVERPFRLNFTANDERIQRFATTSYFRGLATSSKRKDQAANELIDLPLPLDYDSKSNKGKVDKSALADWQQSRSALRQQSSNAIRQSVTLAA